MTLLAQIGHYEIRMVDIPSSGASLLFWLELFDQTINAVIDSCKCRTIREATTEFEWLVEQAGGAVKSASRRSS